MSLKINVLKAFHFSFQPKAGLPTERIFLVGEHEIDESISEHPWIKGGADGHIEAPAAKLERLRAAEKKADEDNVAAVLALKQGEEAFARIQRAAQTEADDKAAVETEAKKGKK